MNKKKKSKIKLALGFEGCGGGNSLGRTYGRRQVAGFWITSYSHLWRQKQKIQSELWSSQKRDASLEFKTEAKQEHERNRNKQRYHHARAGAQQQSVSAAKVRGNEVDVDDD
jgi:hypothetical protein